MIQEEAWLCSLIAAGENEHREFKSTVPSKVRELSEEICAFANSKGGEIWIGVTDDNKIVGVRIDNSKRSAIMNSIREISPPLDCLLETVFYKECELLRIEVPEGLEKPYVLSGLVYLRQGANSQKLTSASSLTEFFRECTKVTFDTGANNDFELQRDLSWHFFRQFKSIAIEEVGIADEQILLNLKCFAKNGKMSRGGTLFFGLAPEKFFPTAVVRCLKFDGHDKRFIQDDKYFKGPLYLQYLQTMDWLKEHLAVRYEIEGSGGPSREEAWEIPTTVFREAILNALAHRDYFDNGACISVEIFDDRVEIANPGGLVPAIPTKEFGTRSHSRNPFIFSLFVRMRLVEHIGSGVIRMQRLMRESGLQPPSFKHEGMFTVVLKRPFDFERWAKSTQMNLSATKLELLRLIEQNGQVSKKELATILMVSETSVEKHLNALRALGLLERIGTKGGYWVLKIQELEYRQNNE